MEIINDALTMKGDLIIIKTSNTGEVETHERKNLVVATGKTYISNRMTANTVNIMSHMAIGTGNTAALTSDTTLETELARVALAVSGGTPSSNTVTYSATFPAGTGTGALAEAGIFNDPTTGSMLCRTVFPVINKQVADTVTITWVVSVT